MPRSIKELSRYKIGGPHTSFECGLRPWAKHAMARLADSGAGGFSSISMTLTGRDKKSMMLLL